MKASDLIEQLKQAIERRGDLEVGVDVQADADSWQLARVGCVYLRNDLIIIDWDIDWKPQTT